MEDGRKDADFFSESRITRITPNQRYECHLGIPRMNADKIAALGFLVKDMRA